MIYFIIFYRRGSLICIRITIFNKFVTSPRGSVRLIRFVLIYNLQIAPLANMYILEKSRRSDRSNRRIDNPKRVQRSFNLFFLVAKLLLLKNIILYYSYLYCILIVPFVIMQNDSPSMITAHI